MTVNLVSLTMIAFVAAVCPLAARLVPNKLVPETVFLLVAGALLGPYLAKVIHLTDSVSLLSNLGLAFLFLLAGYEIDPKNLTGSQGKRGLGTWIVSFAAALLVVGLFPAFSDNHFERIAMAIVLTTTALGTLMPILKERELMKTRVGESILAYGTWGELCPVLAMALLLSSRAEWKTVLVLLAFVALCVLAAVVPARARKAGHRLFKFLTDNADTTSQTMMRVTVLLLVGLVTLSAVFDLDIVLGAFAAGFVLRYVIPEGDDSLEKKLDGLAYGFLIPVFFVVSGAKINLMAVFAQPLLLVGFIVMLLLIRAVPVFVALSTGKDTHDLSSHNRLTVALYCTTALPLIVAATSVAVSAEAMTQEMASVLVAAGAVTVFLMPLLASITYRVADAKPLEAVKEIRQNPRDIGDIVREHMALERMLARQEAAARLAARHRRSLGIEGGEAPWEELAASLQRTSACKRALDEALDLAAQELAAKRAAAGEAANKVIAEAMLDHTNAEECDLYAPQSQEAAAAREEPAAKKCAVAEEVRTAGTAAAEGAWAAAPAVPASSTIPEAVHAAAAAGAAEPEAKAAVPAAGSKHGRRNRAKTHEQKRRELARRRVQRREERRDEIRRRVAERAVREYNRRMAEMGRDANLAGGAFPASRGHAEGTHAANKPEEPKDARTPKDGHAPAPSQEPEQRDRGRSEGGTKR